MNSAGIRIDREAAYVSGASVFVGPAPGNEAKPSPDTISIVVGSPTPAQCLDTLLLYPGLGTD